MLHVKVNGPCWFCLSGVEKKALSRQYQVQSVNPILSQLAELFFTQLWNSVQGKLIGPI